ncbi:IclR family transcriptional regulator [Streptomyces sp. NE06-03E]|uniref:IclR family transcriptional regulator n=1 Tax=unclassified Streptomyces TaxID=2593676 RepID=UPI0029B73315|nr:MULTISPECIES: IclR family transcriptional regulator [unclassified Streptomyces]MDX3054317.1 IclR family transcriptional regulator [Streptomyces sp. NE06-03E]
MDKPLKKPPAYAIASVDHALRLAAMLQLEGAMSVSQAAERLGVARSTAHRLLSMLVYRDFAVQDDNRVYRAGPVLELAAYSQSQTALLRKVALPYLRRLVDAVAETANLSVRTGDTVRFIASVESEQALRIGSREGMVFPAHRTTTGQLVLAELDEKQLAELYAPERYQDRPGERPNLRELRARLARVGRSGFAVNQEFSESGLTAVGVLIHDRSGVPVAGISLALPSSRYHPSHLERLVAALRGTAQAVEAELATGS